MEEPDGDTIESRRMPVKLGSASWVLRGCDCANELLDERELRLADRLLQRSSADSAPNLAER